MGPDAVKPTMFVPYGVDDAGNRLERGRGNTHW